MTTVWRRVEGGILRRSVRRACRSIEIIDSVSCGAVRVIALWTAGMLIHPGNAAAQQSPHGEQLKIACEDCHSASDWKDASMLPKFDHSRTGFSLTGQHAQVNCKQCHATLKFARAPSACANCHKDVHRAELGNTCDRCHSPKSWLVPDMAQRHSATRFPLIGPHIAIPCQACHVSQQKHEYVNVPLDCVGCHRGTYDATTNPAHLANGIGTNCQDCHNLSSLRWAGSFNHAMTLFPLTGAHMTVPCAQCHTTAQYATTPTVCYNCHTDAVTPRAAPVPHTNFSTDCKSCHDTQTWTDVSTASFPHSPPLTGAHLAVSMCDNCHKGNYTSTSQDCYTCHTDAATNRTAPVPHTNFSTDCKSCHDTQTWTDVTAASVPHSPPLTGAHLTVTPCDNCHKGNYTTTSQACYSCHASTMATATTPTPHLNFPTDCSTCHTTMAWTPSTFSHASITTGRFPQDTRHSAPITSNQCSKCHTTSTDYTKYCCQSSGCHNSCAGGN
jgi:hypothetical protein